MIGYVGPKLIAIDNEKIIVKIPYKRRTKNHLNSVYLGALVVGADLVAGFHAFFIAKSMNIDLSIVFKNFNAEFLKRPMSDVYFICNEGEKIKKMIDNSIETGNRITEDILIEAFINYPESPELTCNFILGLSVKNKN
jgi:hypothetical protein